jgi:hypothetical protein
VQPWSPRTPGCPARAPAVSISPSPINKSGVWPHFHSDKTGV